MDLHTVQFSSNTFEENFASNGHGIVDLINVPRVHFDNDSFIMNGDNTYQTS